MKTVTRKTTSTSTNGYGEKVITRTSVASIKMVISLYNKNTVESNNMRIQQCTHIGLTNDTVTVGDLLDDKYEVTFINEAGHTKEVYLKEVESNGSFS